MRILQVDVGKMGRTWLRVLPTVPEVEFVGIVEPVDANREWAMDQLGFGADRCFASVDDALAWDGWDGAAVVTPPVTHRPIAEQILRGGRHVLLEKSLAATIGDAEALLRIAAETGKVLMVAQNDRYRPEIRGVVAAVWAGSSAGSARSRRGSAGTPGRSSARATSATRWTSRS